MRVGAVYSTVVVVLDSEDERNVAIVSSVTGIFLTSDVIKSFEFSGTFN